MLVHSIATEANQRMNFGCPGKNLIDNVIYDYYYFSRVQQHLTIIFLPNNRDSYKPLLGTPIFGAHQAFCFSCHTSYCLIRFKIFIDLVIDIN